MKHCLIAASALICASLSPAIAGCEGGFGRGWSRGKGDGAFTMAASDRSCTLGFAHFIDDSTGASVPAKEVALTKAPKNGKISLSAKGMVYTPTTGFTGKDKFCTKNTAAGIKGTLSGCITVTVE